MKKLLLIPVITMALVGCNKPSNTDVSNNTTVSNKDKKEVVSDNQIGSEGEVEAGNVIDNSYQDYVSLIDEFSKKKTSPLKEGDYENVTLINNRPVKMTVSAKNGKMQKTTNIVGTDDSFGASANYKVVGSTLRYSNIKGDKLLFNPQGEAFVSLDNNFALIDICEPEVSERIPDINEAYDSDTFCKDDVLFTIYRSVNSKN